MEPGSKLAALLQGTPDEGYHIIKVERAPLIPERCLDESLEDCPPRSWHFRTTTGVDDRFVRIALPELRREVVVPILAL